MRGKTKPGETRQGLGFVGDEHYKHFRCFSDEAEQFLFGFVFAEGNALVTYALFSIGTPMRMLLRQSPTQAKRPVKRQAYVLLFSLT